MQLKLPTIIAICNCPKDSWYCRAIQGDDTWLGENFGCGYGKLLSEHFFIDADAAEPIFRRVFSRPYQTRPLRLRSQNTERAALDQMEACDSLLMRLGYKRAFVNSSMYKALKLIHQTIYDRIHVLR